MKKLVKIVKNEDGQALLLMALLIVVLMGFAALVIDLGHVYITKTKLQNAADAAALAGAQDLPNASTAKITAINYAEKNEVPASKTTTTTPYNGDSTKIEVVCTENVSYTFARVLGFTDKDVSARAVAQTNKWAGDALPFINLDGDAEDSTKGETLTGWNKVYPGDKERIHNDDLVVNTDSIKVNYEDGSILYKKGKDMSDINDPLDNILVAGRTVYLFSIKHDEIPNYEKKGSKELKEGDKIPLSDVVLLECKVIAWDGKIVTLEFENSYFVSTSGITTATDGSDVKQFAKLVE